MTESHVTTLERFILEDERRRPEATGAFSNILYALTLAAKIISREVNKAGIVDVLGSTGEENVQGEVVQKLDVFAEQVIYNALDHIGHLCCMVSEEREELIHIPERFPKGEYIFVFDPLDGSSNIDVNVSIGTIFSILRKKSNGKESLEQDCLQPGTEQLAAGYVLYGSSTMLVYSVGRGVHGFTLDPSIGEFLLSHRDIRIPDPPSRVYSVNEANYPYWSEGQRRLMQRLKGLDGTNGPRFSSRYIGSMVADVHRTLMKGGIFMYPGDKRNPNGKLRLLYEANPLAFLAEQAGGSATDGKMRILDKEPTALHQRTPLIIGSRDEVTRVQEFCQPE